MPSGGDIARRFWLVVAVTVVADRVTKMIAAATLPGRVVPVLGDVAQFRLVRNPGAAFGLELGAWQRWIFILIAVIAIVWLYRAARAAAPGDWLRQYSVALVAGGAAGNLVDRLLSNRGVVDFIDIGIGSTRWPTFNLADTAVTCGAIALAISLWREDVRAAATTPSA